MRKIMKLALIAVTAIFVQMGSVDKADALVLTRKACGQPGQPACITVALTGASGNPGAIDWSTVSQIDWSMQYASIADGGAMSLFMIASGISATNVVSHQALNLGSLSSLMAVKSIDLQILMPGQAMPMMYSADTQQGGFLAEYNSEEHGVNIFGPESSDPLFSAGVSVNAAPVPEPSTIFLFGAGIAGLVAVRSRRRAKNSAL